MGPQLKTIAVGFHLQRRRQTRRDTTPPPAPRGPGRIGRTVRRYEVACDSLDPLLLRVVVDGQDTLVIDDEMLNRLLEARINALCERAGLSKRERAVLDLMVLGRSQKDVARVLRISVRTVKYHEANVHRKLGADSRLDLMRLFL